MPSKLILDMAPVKQTDNTVVFSEKLDESNPLSFRRVSGLYIQKRDLKDMGWTGDSFKLTIEAS
jgi:hypothetical protein